MLGLVLMMVHISHHAVFTTDEAFTGNELIIQNMSNDFVYEPIQVSILDKALQYIYIYLIMFETKI